MYTDTSHPITLFALPTTLAGDCAVTILVQSLMTWFITYALIRQDLRKHRVQPFGFLPQPISPMVRKLFLLDEQTQSNSWGKFLLENVVRALIAAVVGLLVFWAPCVGVLMAVGTKVGADWVYDAASWTPEVFKFVLGGGLAMVQTPVFASFWLVREGWLWEGRNGEAVEGEDGTMVGE